MKSTFRISLIKIYDKFDSFNVAPVGSRANANASLWQLWERLGHVPQLR
jgi:hypothetical protein